MESTTRPTAEEKGLGIPPRAAKAIDVVKAILPSVKLDELGLRQNEHKLVELLEEARVIGSECWEITKTQMTNICTQVKSLGYNPTMTQILWLEACLMNQVKKEHKLRIVKESLDPWFQEMLRQWNAIGGEKETEREKWTRAVVASFGRFVKTIVAYHPKKS